MTRLWKFVVAVALAGLVMPRAWADVSAQGGNITETQSINTYVCQNFGATNGGCSNVLAANTKILGFKLVSRTAGVTCALFDATTVPTTTIAGMIDDIDEATDEDTNLHIWPHPYTLVNGLSIGIGGAVGAALDRSVCIVYY